MALDGYTARGDQRNYVMTLNRLADTREAAGHGEAAEGARRKARRILAALQHFD